MRPLWSCGRMESETFDLRKKRRWPRWPWLILAAYFLLVFGCNAFAASFATSFLIVILVFVWIGLVFVMAVVGAIRFKDKQPERAVAAVLPPVLVSLMLLSTPLAEWAGDWASFYRLRSSLQSKVDQAPGDDQQKLIVFLTDGFLDSGHGYAYDGSDELRLPAGTQSEAWKKRAYRTEFEDMCFGASHITGHYYSFVVNHGCDGK